MKFSECTAKNIEEVFGELKTSEGGLSEGEIANRLKFYGFNEIKAKEAGLIPIFWRQLKSPFFYLLFIASLIAFLIGEKIDGILILFFVAINVFLGFFQEAKAQKAVLFLKRYLPSKVLVKREGKEKLIEKRELVPGDIVLLKSGNIVPADLRVIKIKNLLVDESILTGESVSVSKISQVLEKETKEIFEAKNILFSGTSIISGEAEGVVIATGKETVFGEITKLVSKIEKESVYERDLMRFARLILRIVVLTIAFIFLANLAIKGSENLLDFLIFCVALIVSILPEALPVVVTFAFSQGALKLAKEKVLVKRLSAVEDLGDIEILCADKTGTLTENKLSLEKISALDKEKCLKYGFFSSTKSPFDLALLQFANQNIRQSLKKIKTISEIPFDSFRMRNSVLIEVEDGKKILIVRGAPEVILKLCSNFEGNLKQEMIYPVKSSRGGISSLTKLFNGVKKEIEKEGREGKRTLAVAFKEFEKSEFSEKDEKDLTFLGYFSFRDPLKKTAKPAIQLAKKLGVQVKILTGDSSEVAGQIGKEIGLVDDSKEVILGERLESLSEEDFKKACQEFSIFARVSPTTKYKIVKTLEENYEVGFLGEGVNDAPALKAVHLAVAVAGAADVAREASDVILLKRDLKVIIDGIRQGRNIFANINKYIKCTLSSNFGNFYSIALISLLIPFLPMLPTQILLVNLLSDFPLIAVATDKVDVEELKKPKLYQLNKFILLILLLALTSTVFDFIFFGIFHKTEPSLLRTLWFIESILTEIVLIFSIRTFHFFARAKLPSIPLMIIAFFTFLITIFLPFTNFGKEMFHFVSPSISSLLIVFSLIVSYFIVSELVKLIYFQHWQDRRSS
jgi:Mg2+-importing ATPase